MQSSGVVAHYLHADYWYGQMIDINKEIVNATTEWE